MLNEHTNTNKQTTTSLKSMEKMSFVAVQALIDRTTFVMDEPVIKEFCIILSVTTALQTLQCILPSEYLSHSRVLPESVVSHLTLGDAEEHYFPTRVLLA